MNLSALPDSNRDIPAYEARVLNPIELRAELVGVAGIEPTTFCSRNRRATTALHPEKVPPLPVDRRGPEAYFGARENNLSWKNPEIALVFIEDCKEIEVSFQVNFSYETSHRSTFSYQIDKISTPASPGHLHLDFFIIRKKVVLHLWIDRLVQNSAVQQRQENESGLGDLAPFTATARMGRVARPAGRRDWRLRPDSNRKNFLRREA